LPCTNNQDFIDMVSAIANRYKGKIKHYETWNEPGGGFFTGTLAQLVVLQNDVYNTVKAIDPTATVHTPVVGLSGNPDCTNSSAGTFSLNAFVRPIRRAPRPSCRRARPPAPVRGTRDAARSRPPREWSRRHRGSSRRGRRSALRRAAARRIVRRCGRRGSASGWSTPTPGRSTSRRRRTGTAPT